MEYKRLLVSLIHPHIVVQYIYNYLYIGSKVNFYSYYVLL